MACKLVFTGLLILFWAMPVLADTVLMNNGDKLSGQIKQLANGKLSLLSDYGGLINLDWDQVKSITSTSKIIAADNSERQQYLEKMDGNDAEIIIVSTEEQELESEEHAAELTKPTFWGTSDWKGNLDLSLNHKSASSRTADYAAKLKTKWRSGQWRHSIDADYARKTSNSVTTSHNYGARLSSNRFLTDQWFWQGRGLYKWDQIEDVSRQMAVGTGPGYQFWEDETGAFSVAGLLSRVRYDYHDGFRENFYAASLNWDYSRYLRGDRLELYTTGELMRPLSNAAEISIDAAIGLRYRMTDWLSWFLSYSRNQISGGRENLDEKRISTGLGLSW